MRFALGTATNLLIGAQQLAWLVAKRMRTTSPGVRQRLERHVVEVQKTVRTCAGCGLCCTEAHNSVRIVSSEAERIAAHLQTLSTTRRAALLARVAQSIDHYGLRATKKQNYTCPFLEQDLTCALPLQVKPVACLAFNPLTPDACDQEPEWYAEAHAPELKASQKQASKPALKPIPVALMNALRDSAASATSRRPR